MKVIWAPWRMDYILSNKEEGCIFCPGEDRDHDEDRLILYIDEYKIVLKYPSRNTVEINMNEIGHI